jgi:hypothetical protein
MSNYKKTLDFITTNNISVLDVVIACECESVFDFDYTDEQFEKLCELAKGAKLKGERYIDECAVATAINYMINDKGKTIDDVLNTQIWDIVQLSSDFI